MTTPSAANSRVPSMPEKASAESAAKPPGPVMCTCSPSVPRSAVARMSSTASLIVVQPLGSIVDRHDDLGRLRGRRAVELRAERAVADDAVRGHRPHGRGVLPDLRDVRRSQPARPGVDDDRGRGLGHERLLELDHLGGLGVARQPAGRVVLLGVGQLLRERRERGPARSPTVPGRPTCCAVRTPGAPRVPFGRPSRPPGPPVAPALRDCSWRRSATSLPPGAGFRAAGAAKGRRLRAGAGAADLVCWGHDRADQPQHPFRGLRPARRGGEGGGRRRLAPCRRHGLPLRAQPDAGPAGRGVAAQGHRHPARLPSDDRAPRPLGAGLRGGGRVLGDLPRGGRLRPRAHRPGDPGQGGPGVDGAEARARPSSRTRTCCPSWTWC